MNRLDRVLSQWVRLGAMFDASPAAQTPDIEALLVETAGEIPSFARLCGMTVSWLARYYRLVCRHRLAVLADPIADARASAALGYVLTLAGREGRTDHFNLAVRACRPLSPPGPLYDVYRRSGRMISLARAQADPAGEKWGLWAPPERLYADAVRPPEWVTGRNPALARRADFAGKLPASILVFLQSDARAGQSESALARACHATRAAVRDALEHLELSRLVRRERAGNSTRIVLRASGG